MRLFLTFSGSLHPHSFPPSLLPSFPPSLLPPLHALPACCSRKKSNLGSMNIQFWHANPCSHPILYTHTSPPPSTSQHHHRPPLPSFLPLTHPRPPVSELYITYPNTFTFINAPFPADSVLCSLSMFWNGLYMRSRLSAGPFGDRGRTRLML